MKAYKIHAIPADGIGSRVISAGMLVLDALASQERRSGIDLTCRAGCVMAVDVQAWDRGVKRIAAAVL